MKKPIALFLLVLLAVTVRAALPQPDLVAQIYFAGEQKILAAPNVNAFTNEFCSPQAVALRRQTVNKLAPWLAAFLQGHTGASAPNGAMWLRPLLDDLQTTEWMVEARAPGSGPVELALAIRLDNIRSQTWASSLKLFFPAATFTTANGWLVFDSGTGAPKLGNDVAQKAAGPHPEWFGLEVNWPRLAQWYPEVGKLGLPETKLTITAPDKNFLIQGTFYYPQPLTLNTSPWQFPANLVHQPLASFTAIRGFGPWLQSQDWAQSCQITPAPNQAYFWAIQKSPFQSYFAIPVLDGDRAMDQAYNCLAALIKNNQNQDNFIIPTTLTRTNNGISLQGVPMAQPFLQPVKGPGGQFLFGGAFPNSSISKQLPPELLNQLDTKNLVYYQWEITALRGPTLLPVSQLGLYLTRHTQLDGNSIAYKWLNSAERTLGNTETEITQTSPDQLKFVRSAPGLFTALEFFILANWLEAKNFPGCDLSLPPMSEKMKEILRQRKAGAAVPIVVH